MRLFIFNCLLLAIIAAASAHGRHKKNLTYLKNLITSAIFGRGRINITLQTDSQEEKGFKLFRVPGYDDIMIKITPKKPVLEEFVYPRTEEKVNLNAFRTVVSTKTKDAIPMIPLLNTPGYVVKKKVKAAPVIESRPMLTEVTESRPVHKELFESMPMIPLLNTPSYVVKEKVKAAPVLESRNVLTEVTESRPFFKEVFESMPVNPLLNTPSYVVKEKVNSAPVIESKPVFTEVIESRPVLKEVLETGTLEEKVEIKVPFEPTYSYKQMQNSEPVMTYTAHTNPGVEVMETLKMKTELPLFIKKRVDEAIVLGADPERFFPVQEVFQYQSPPVAYYSYPRVETNTFVQSADPNLFTPVQEMYEYQTAPLIDFSYPRVDMNSYVQNSFREEVEGFETVGDFGSTHKRMRPFKHNPILYNLDPRKTLPINPRPVPLHSHKSPHFKEDIITSKNKIDSQTKKVQAFNNMGERVDIAQTLGIIPYQYITPETNKSEKFAASNENITKQLNAVPLVASKDNVANAKIPPHVYKKQSDPNTGKVVKESNLLKTNVESFNEYIATHVLAPKRGNTQEKNIVFTNKVTTKPASVTSVSTRTSTSTDVAKQRLKENIQTPLVSSPVVVKDNKSYSYQQKHADGSSLNVRGNKHGVAVNFKENNNRGRGDIPDQ